MERKEHVPDPRRDGLLSGDQGVGDTDSSARNSVTFIVLVNIEGAKSPPRTEKLRPGKRPKKEVQGSLVWNLESNIHTRAGSVACCVTVGK